MSRSSLSRSSKISSAMCRLRSWRILPIRDKKQAKLRELKQQISRQTLVAKDLGKKILLPSSAVNYNGRGQDSTEIAIAAIFYNEAAYLKEWIEFHLMVGVDRFLLYDNGSTDDFLPILDPYVRRGQVSLIPWRNFVAGGSSQLLAYAHAARNCGLRVKWLAFLDLDEFLFSEAYDTVKPVFAKFTDFGSLLIPRFEFGTNGHRDKQTGLVIENYTKVSSYHKNKTPSTKIAAQPSSIQLIYSAHYAVVMRNELRLSYVMPGECLLRINHYFSKSEEEFREKLRRGYAWKSDSNAEEKIEKLTNLDNDGRVYSMERFSERLRGRV